MKNVATLKSTREVKCNANRHIIRKIEQTHVYAKTNKFNKNKLNGEPNERQAHTKKTNRTNRLTRDELSNERTKAEHVFV